MNTAFALRGIVTLSEWVLMATAILLLARLITIFACRNAAMCHLIWLIAFSSLLVTPALVAIVPTHFVVQMPVAMSPPTSSPSGEIALAGAEENSAPTPMNHGLQIAEALLAIWFAGVGVVAIMGIAAAYGISRIRHHSMEHTFDSLDLPELTSKIGLKRNWNLRVSSTQNPSAAMTWGFLRPVILLPKDSVFWPKDRLEAVLLHELAHVRRYDSLSQWLTFIVCALYWFHPGVWRSARIVRSKAELAADDAVLASGVKPSVYAAVLLRFAAELGQSSAPFAYAGVSFMRQSRIAARIESILNADHRDRKVTSMQKVKALTLGLASVLFLAAMRPSVSLANYPPVAHLSIAPVSLEAPNKSKSPFAQPTKETGQAALLHPVSAKNSGTKHCQKKLAAKKSVKPPSAG